jgi:hypothetical protein
MSRRMNHPTIKKVRFCLFAALLGGIAGAHAGETVVPRRSFRESKSYPHIFQPEGYLATSGPVPMNIEQKPAAFSKRLAPPLPENARGKEKPLPPLPEPNDEQAGAAPEKVMRAGHKKEELPLPEPDLGKVPEAVLRFFRERDGQAQPVQPNLFDPIFQPARASELPKGKATYVQKR